MPCKACHKPKLKPIATFYFFERGKHYVGGLGGNSTYIVADIDDKLALVNIKSGFSWSGLRTREELERERKYFDRKGGAL